MYFMSTELNMQNIELLSLNNSWYIAMHPKLYKDYSQTYSKTMCVHRVEKFVSPDSGTQVANPNSNLFK